MDLISKCKAVKYKFKTLCFTAFFMFLSLVAQFPSLNTQAYQPYSEDERFQLFIKSLFLI